MPNHVVWELHHAGTLAGRCKMAHSISKTKGSDGFGSFSFSGSRRLSRRYYQSIEHMFSPWEVAYNTVADSRESIAGTNGNYHAYNGVNHSVSKVLSFGTQVPDLLPPVSLDQLDTSWRVTGWKDCVINGNTSFKTFFGDGQPPVYDLPSIDWDSIVSQVGDRLDGSLEASDNIYLFLLDSVKTLNAIRNPFGARDLLKRFSRKDLGRQTLKQLANSRLEYRYGWRQVVRSIKAFTESYSKVQQHVAYLQKTIGRDVSLGARQTDVAFGENPYSFGYAPEGVEVKIDECKVKRTAAFSLILLRSESFRLASTWEYTQQYLGMHQLYETLWDAVPFSFVLDWFIQTESLVNRIKMNFNSYNLRRVGHSVKYEWSLRGTARTVLSALGQTEEFETSFGGDVLRQYQRTPGLPGYTGSGGIFSSLNMTQLVDLGALIAQRL